MERKNGIHFREIIERYCNVIGSNAAILRICTDNRVSYECLQRANCERLRGGCKNEKYGK